MFHHNQNYRKHIYIYYLFGTHKPNLAYEIFLNQFLNYIMNAFLLKLIQLNEKNCITIGLLKSSK